MRRSIITSEGNEQSQRRLLHKNQVSAGAQSGMEMDSTLNATFGKRIPVTQCSNGQEVRELAAKIKENQRRGFLQSPFLEKRVIELEIQVNTLKFERDKYFALSEQLTTENQNLVVALSNEPETRIVKAVVRRAISIKNI